ncbi:hypothetical protein PQX77_005612 [Marasmius sp. AFHP31]|nr:hypothetical protein PQX77_005612 [Marasmius sp. AFHP31]
MAGQELTANDLLRNIPSTGYHGELSYTDGLIASLHPRTREFVTSPNVSSIPPPPFGSTRDLYRREDGFYGHDDPILTPQPFNKHHPYLPWVSSRPSSDSHPHELHACMWTRLTQYDVEYPQGEDRKEGVIRPRIAREIDDAIGDLRQRSAPYRQVGVVGHVNVGQLLCEFDDTLTVCYNRITNVSMSLRDIKLGLAEVQRAWLYSIALLDWLDAAKDQFDGQAGQTLDPRHRMGAFVWTDQDALHLWRNKVPVYYIRPYGAFNRQMILSVQPFLTPVICDTPATPPYPVILANSQAGSDNKFAALRGAAATCFVSSSPFENMHLPGAYISSYGTGSSTSIVSPTYSPLSSSGAQSIASSSSSTPAHNLPPNRYSPYSANQPRRRGKKKTQQNPPQEQRSLFADIVHPLLPPLLTPFAGLNELIDIHHPRRHHETGKAPKLATVVPDPAVFTGPKEQAKRDVFLRGWQAFRSSWLARCQSSSGNTSFVANQVWKKLLYLEATGPSAASSEASSGSEREHQEASSLLSETLQQFPPSSNPQSSLTDEGCKAMMHELSFINFRSQLVALDIELDQSLPQQDPSISAAELFVAKLAHRRQRMELVDGVFGGHGEAFSVGQLTFMVGFAAERWPERAHALRSLATLMDSWPGDKDAIWSRRDDPNFASLVGPGLEWEKVVYKYYVQSYYNTFGHPPVLPRCRV